MSEPRAQQQIFLAEAPVRDLVHDLEQLSNMLQIQEGQMPESGLDPISVHYRIHGVAPKSLVETIDHLQNAILHMALRLEKWAFGSPPDVRPGVPFIAITRRDAVFVAGLIWEAEACWREKRDSRLGIHPKLTAREMVYSAARVMDGLREKGLEECMGSTPST